MVLVTKILDCNLFLVKIPSCYFQSIHLAGIKSFDEAGQTLSFIDQNGLLAQWTLILGDNGLGKTTILQALTDVCADLTQPGRDDGDGDVIYTPRAFTNRRGFKHYGRVGTNKGGIQAAFVAQVRLRHELDKSCLSYVFTFDFLNSTMQSEFLYQPYASLQPMAYGTFRRFGSTELSADLEEDSCKTLFDENHPLINVEEWLLRADYAATKSTDIKAKQRLERVKRLLVELLPEVSEIRIQASGIEIPTPEALTPSGWVPVRALSTGYRATMAWLTDLATRMLDRYPESSQPFAEPAVVLVDQIDIHLHPKWQRQLIQDLSRIFPKTQFIVTAHSPLMVQAMPGANLVVLRREGDHVKICNHPDDVRGWRLDQIVASDLFEELPTRDIDTEPRLIERRSLLAKNRLTKPQQTRLAELNEWAATLPTADAPDDIRAMELIRRAAAKLNEPKP